MDTPKQVALARAAIRRSWERASHSRGVEASCFEVSELREAIQCLTRAVEDLACHVEAVQDMLDA